MLLMYKAAGIYHGPTNLSTSSPLPISPAGLGDLFDAQHRASRAQVDARAVRRDRLLRMQALLARLLAASFSSDEWCVVQGDGAQPGMRLMEEEIVAPVLPVLVVQVDACLKRPI